MTEFINGQRAVKLMVAQALSRIHISFDIWTLPSALLILGICAHFLSSDLQLKHPLLGLKYLEGSHTGEAIAEVLRRIMEEYEVVDKWGVMVADNATNCDSACAALVQQLRPEEDKAGRRVRCFGYILNLAA